ncbi:carbohydrate-binding module family 50 protein [Periconia macrospinosa]|uniref:Carbohydrate-binding module family 50 protein n=1 Tax=Periconia macrospinosa TaxID=97972 RepID=A0A2V1D6W3_9PLEO|nr:carbohydrate-binding module family 50 protein [Periconia macrospinosa]
MITGFSQQAEAYLVDPPTTAAVDTIQDCSNWVVVTNTDKCQDLAIGNGLTEVQFQAYNPSIGSSCKLISGNSYCIEQNWGIPPETTSAATTTTPSPTNSITTPTPTQSPFVGNCNKFYLVKKDDGCEAIALANGISFEQFYSWNPAVGQCANLWPTYYVCVGIIGSTPTPTTTTSTTPTTPTNGITTPAPTQSPFINNCNKFYLVKKDDGCESIALANGISFDRFYAWNPAVGKCANLWPDYYVCVGIIGFTPTSTPTPTTTTRIPTNGIATPTPTQSGMVANCDSFYKVVRDDGCEAIAAKQGITPNQFYAWNPFVGTDCKNLWPDYYVCVSIIGIDPTFTTSIKPTMTQPGNGIATPTPIQDGMTRNCKRFYKVETDDGCWAIANSNQINLNDFYAWNPAVKTDCSGLFPGYYVCIGV